MALTDLELSEAADMLGWQSEILFQSRLSRDEVAAMAKANGVGTRKSSMSNQLLDPRYTFEGRHLPDRGLANDYKHHHPTLYVLTVTSRPA